MPAFWALVSLLLLMLFSLLFVLFVQLLLLLVLLLLLLGSSWCAAFAVVCAAFADPFGAFFSCVAAVKKNCLVLLWTTLK